MKQLLTPAGATILIGAVLALLGVSAECINFPERAHQLNTLGPLTGFGVAVGLGLLMFGDSKSTEPLS